MTRSVLIAVLSLVWASPLAAQQMDSSMPGMKMPVAKPAAKAKKSANVQPAGASQTQAAPMAAMPGMASAPPVNLGPPAAHDMANMPGMNKPAAATAANPAPAAMPGMTMPTAQGSAPMVEGAPPLPTVQTPPPPVPTDFAADRDYDGTAMQAARALVHREHGGDAYSMVMANILEYQSRSGGGGYRWEGQAWIGGDINRFVLKSEGEGSRRDGLEAAEVQALYSRAIGPYFNIQAGVRQDFDPTPKRTYATLGVEGLAPYWFDVQGAIFLSNKGELLGRAEATYDLRLTQRLILQPRTELNFSAQNIPEIGVGSGIANAELGLRLRYEISRQFAPYVGVSFDRKVGRTADYARTAGKDPGGVTFVSGIRAWF
jgi:copper resistance protein B